MLKLKGSATLHHPPPKRRISVSTTTVQTTRMASPHPLLLTNKSLLCSGRHPGLPGIIWKRRGCASWYGFALLPPPRASQTSFPFSNVSCLRFAQVGGWSTVLALLGLAIVLVGQLYLKRTIHFFVVANIAFTAFFGLGALLLCVDTRKASLVLAQLYFAFIMVRTVCLPLLLCVEE